MIAKEDGRMVLKGRLTMSTVPALYEAGLKHLTDEDMTVDMSKVEAVDSAAVSMLLGWARAAQKSGRTLTAVHLPEDLLSLAHLYGVSDMLPVSPA